MKNSQTLDTSMKQTGATSGSTTGCAAGELDIQTVMGIELEEPVALYVRGHVDLRQFEEAAREYEGRYGDPEVIGKAYHEWWRKVPRGRDGDCQLYRATLNMRGAFPVTAVDLTEWVR